MRRIRIRDKVNHTVVLLDVDLPLYEGSAQYLSGRYELDPDSSVWHEIEVTIYERKDEPPEYNGQETVSP